MTDQTQPRCTCLIRGAHSERPRRRVVPHRVVRLPGRRAFYLPPVETDDPRCPVHGIAGRKIMRRIQVEQ